MHRVPGFVPGVLVIGMVLGLVAAIAHAADTAPPWLLEATRQPAPSKTDDAAARVLLDEHVVTIGAKGRRETRQRCVVRILERDGRKAALARINFEAKIDKVSDFRAWVILDGGLTRAFDHKDVVQLATSLEALYADARVAIIDATAEADAGSVFGWEGTLDELSWIGQGIEVLQGPNPVAVARVVVRVPKGWALQGSLRGHAPVEPQVDGDSYTWHLRDLPAFEQEPFGPDGIGAKINLAYDIRPPQPVRHLRTFDSWADVVAHALELQDRPAEPDAATRVKARELCGDSTTLWDKIRVLGTYTQKLRYISISMNLGKGGGYTPHPAGEVLRCGYGDCKDKTSLLRALLAAEGVRAWPVLCYSGDPTSVKDDWPSPTQFNHVFTAIELGDAPVPDSTFVVEHPPLGRLLLFDPTDPHSLIGDFPGDNQGAHVLICTPGTTGLTPVPTTPPQRNQLRRIVTVALETAGDVRIATLDTFSGSAGAEARAFGETAPNLHEFYEKRLRSAHPGARLDTITFEPNDEGSGKAVLRTTFAAPRFCRVIRDRLLLFPPVVRVDEVKPILPPEPRTQPIILPSLSVDESTEFILPKGFRVAELGKPRVIESPFGRFELTMTAEERSIVVRRQRSMQRGVYPASDGEAIRAFDDAVRKAETTPIVLERVAAP